MSRIAPVLLAASCVSGALVPPPVVPVPDRAPTAVEAADGLFPIARTTAVAGELPGWFAEPTPTTVVPHEGRSPVLTGMPLAQLRERLCAGDAEGWARWTDALDRAFAAGQTADAVVADLGTLVEGCGDPRICAPALALATQATRPAHVVGYHALQSCSDPGAAVAMTAPDVPPRTVAAYWSARAEAQDLRAYVPGLGAALLRLVRAGDEDATRALAIALGATDDRRAAAELLAAWGVAHSGRLKDLVAAGMYQQSEPQAAFVFAGLCARPYVAEPLCDPDNRPDPAPALSCRALFDLAIRTGRLDAEADLIATCLEEVARLDWGAAAQVAAALPLAEADRAALHPILDALGRYPSAAAQEAALRELGLLTRARPIGGPRPVDTLSVLEWFDQASAFRASPDDWPAPHDGLLWRLASLADPPWTDVGFEQLAPAPGPIQTIVDGEVVEEAWSPDPDRPYAPEGIYLVRAYAGGRRWEVRVEDNPDRWAVDTLIGLLNVVAAETGRPTRWMRAQAEPGIEAVVAGPEAGLRRAVAAGLVTPARGG